MPSIKLHVKPDNTFLTNIMYEGILALIQYNRDRATVSLDKVDLPANALRRLFKQISMDEKLSKTYRSIYMRLIGNDIKHKIGEKILESAGITGVQEKITSIGQIIDKLLENYDMIIDIPDTDYTYTIARKNLVIGSPGKKVISAPQIFKADRYTGFTTLDMDTTFEQFTVKSEPVFLIIGALGLASSYISGADNHYYFLFLSPDEILEALARRDPEYIYNIMSIKRRVIEELRGIMKTRLPEEAIILKIALDLNIYKELAGHEIDHLSMQLYVVAHEGNAVKIYGKIPLTIYSKPYRIYVLEKITGKPEKLLEALSEALGPGSPVVKALQLLTARNKPADADHALRSVRELYRLIASGDISGLYGFLRELGNAERALEAEHDASSIRRAEAYARLLTRISRSLVFSTP